MARAMDTRCCCPLRELVWVAPSNLLWRRQANESEVLSSQGERLIARAGKSMLERNLGKLAADV